MRVRRPDQPGRTRSRLALLFLWLAAAMLTACGGAAYSKAAYGPPPGQGGYVGETSVTSDMEAPNAPEPAPPMAAESAASDEGYGFEFDDDTLAGGGFGPNDAAVRVRPAPTRNAQVDRRTAQTPAADKKPAEAAPGQPTEPAQIASDVAAIQQMLIYTAQLRMAVFETTKSLAAVEDLARELGGFLAHRADNQITIRVPAARFDEAMKRIAGQGDVLSRNVQVEDVTEQFLDMSLRLKNARQVRERIAALLANAKNVEDSLKVEQELNRLSEEIERLEGRLKYLSDRARYSTITVTFEPVRTDDVNPNRVFQLPFPWLEDLGLGRLMTLR